MSSSLSLSTQSRKRGAANLDDGTLVAPDHKSPTAAVAAAEHTNKQQRATIDSLYHEVSGVYLLQRFVLVRPALGAGSCGTVYRVAQDTKSAAPPNSMAVKVCQDDEDDDGDTLDAIEATKSEVRAHHRASDHPNVVRLYDAFYCRRIRQAWMLMEYADRGALSDVFAADPQLCRAHAAAIVRQVCAALAHCHSVGVLHLDVSAPNIVLRGDMSAALTDFGLARVRLLNDAGLPQPVRNRATVTRLHYRAPEVLLSVAYGDKAVALNYDAATDMWSLGCVVALLCGALPELHRADYQDQQLRAVLETAAPEQLATWSEGAPLLMRWRVAKNSGAPPVCDVVARATSIALADGLLGSGAGSLMWRLLQLSPTARPRASVALRCEWLADAVTHKASL